MDINLSQVGAKVGVRAGKELPLVGAAEHSQVASHLWIEFSF